MEIKETANPAVQEVTYERSVLAKLRKRIHLPTEIYEKTHEERFLVSGDTEQGRRAIIEHNFLSAYNYKSGLSIVWMDSRYAILKAEKVEVILRRYPGFGVQEPKHKIILFRIWKETNHG